MRRFSFLSVLTAVLILLPAQAQAQFKGMAHRCPAKTNALVAINKDKVLASPVAATENWRDEHERAFQAGMTVLPPGVDQFLLAAEIDYDFFQPIWQVALMRTGEAPSMAEIAARRGGEVDSIDGKNAAVLPEDTYIVEFGPTLVGAMSPGNRQSVARWVRSSSAAGRKPLTPYLESAIGFADDVGTPIIMALDLADIVQPNELRAILEKFPEVQELNVDLDKLSAALASIQGVTLGITLKDKVFGKVKVDFGEDISMLGAAAKPLLLAALGEQGAMIDEFEDWHAKVSAHQISIEGYLGRSGLQRIFSVLDAPPSMQQSSQYASDAPDEESLKRLSSQQYFKSVDSYLTDLQRKKGAKSMGQAASWYERYARKIDQLPLLNVDEQLLDYGAFVAQSLRAASATLKTGAARASVRQANAPAQYQTVYGYAGGARGRPARWGRYGWYGGYATYEDTSAESAEAARIRREERVGGAAGARDIMADVTQATADIRREMTQKYQAEF